MQDLTLAVVSVSCEFSGSVWGFSSALLPLSKRSLPALRRRGRLTWCDWCEFVMATKEKWKWKEISRKNTSNFYFVKPTNGHKMAACDLTSGTPCVRVISGFWALSSARPWAKSEPSCVICVSGRQSYFGTKLRLVLGAVSFGKIGVVVLPCKRCCKNSGFFFTPSNFPILIAWSTRRSMVAASVQERLGSLVCLLLCALLPGSRESVLASSFHRWLALFMCNLGQTSCLNIRPVILISCLLYY